MNFDALTLAAVVDELQPALLGGRVQRVLLPDHLGLALELYAHQRTWWLYCSAHPQHARVHLLTRRPIRGSDEVSPLLLLLRKYVRDGRLARIEQVPYERILCLGFETREPETRSELRATLVVEVMGRHSNLILHDESALILDSAKRIGADLSRYRQVLPRQPYRPPPPQVKARPNIVSGATLAGAAAVVRADLPLWQLLVAQVQACSPLLAREVGFRATGDVAVPCSQVRDWDSIAATLHALFDDAERRAWTPCVAEGPAGVAFAPYQLTHLPHVRPVESISAAVEAGFARPAAGLGAADPRQRLLQDTLQAQRARLLRKQQALRQGLVDEAELDRLRQSGEYILAFQHTLHSGAAELVVPELGFHTPLDPDLNAVEHAQRCFREYGKAKSAVQGVPRLITKTEHQLAYLDDLLVLVSVASSPAEVARLAKEWEDIRHQWLATGEDHAHGSASPEVRRRKRDDGGAYRRTDVDGFVVLVGRTGRGNDAVLKGSSPRDLWLHARGVPGAHVAIRAQGRDVPEHVLRAAASLAAGHSQARRATSVAVDYTERRHVDRISGTPPGRVTYRHERTIHVPPRHADALSDGYESAGQAHRRAARSAARRETL